MFVGRNKELSRLNGMYSSDKLNIFFFTMTICLLIFPVSVNAGVEIRKQKTGADRCCSYGKCKFKNTKTDINEFELLREYGEAMGAFSNRYYYFFAEPR